MSILDRVSAGAAAFAVAASLAQSDCAVLANSDVSPPAGHGTRVSVTTIGRPNLLVTSFRGSWSLASCGRGDSARLDLRYEIANIAGHQIWDDSRCVSSAELHGISASRLPTSGDRTFEIRRDAGTFEASGSFDANGGRGTWTFVPSQNYAVRLDAAGSGTPTLEQQFALMMSDFDLASFQVLAQHGYTPSVDQLVRAGEIGADPAFLAAASALPSDGKNFDDLLRLRERGFSMAEVPEFEKLGYHPTIEQFITLTERGIHPAVAQRLQAKGLPSGDVEALIQDRSY